MQLLGDIIDINGDGQTNGIEIVITDIIVFAALVGALIAIYKFVKSINGTKMKVDSFLDDWYGEEPRAGIEPRLGVLTRLHDLEEDRAANSIVLGQIQATVNQIQGQVEHELNRNGGGSTKDAAHEALRVAKEIQVTQQHAAEEQALFREKYLQDQRVSRQEWEAVFATVKEMIGKPVEEQMLLWTRASGAYMEDDGA